MALMIIIISVAFTGWKYQLLEHSLLDGLGKYTGILLHLWTQLVNLGKGKNVPVPKHQP
jgi:hypothetical protein